VAQNVLRTFAIQLVLKPAFNGRLTSRRGGPSCLLRQTLISPIGFAEGVLHSPVPLATVPSSVSAGPVISSSLIEAPTIVGSGAVRLAIACAGAIVRLSGRRANHAQEEPYYEPSQCKRIHRASLPGDPPLHLSQRLTALDNCVPMRSAVAARGSEVLVGSRLIEATIQGRLQGRRRRGSFVPICRSALRCA
jgi:hypothetical protein